MIIDITCFFLLVMALLKGYSKGLIVAVFSFVGLIAGLAAALKLSVTVAGYLEEQTGTSGAWLPFISFTLVFIAVLFLVKIGASVLKKAAGLVMLGWVDTLGGILLFGMAYLMAFSIVLFYATQLHLISTEVQEASKTYGYIAPWGPMVINGLGKFIPFFSEMFGQLGRFFEKVSIAG